METNWVVVRNCSWLQEAGFVKSLLESEGLDVQIPDEYAVGVNPGYTNMFGGIRVMVHEDQLARANQILESSELAAIPTEE